MAYTTCYAGGSEKALAMAVKKKLLLISCSCGLDTATSNQKEGIQDECHKKFSTYKMELQILETKRYWRLKGVLQSKIMNIVFAPKYRRQIIYGDIKEEVGKILRELCTWKQVTILEAELCKDHIHMLVEIPPKMSVSSFVGFLKGKSSLIIHERHANLKYKYGSRHFWCRGYYIDTVGKNTKRIADYIKNQLEEDKLADQLTFREYEDPFKGSK